MLIQTEVPDIMLANLQGFLIIPTVEIIGACKSLSSVRSAPFCNALLSSIGVVCSILCTLAYLDINTTGQLGPFLSQLSSISSRPSDHFDPIPSVKLKQALRVYYIHKL